MKQLWGVIDFVRAARTRLRFGELSRAPLKLLRVQWEGESMECDWQARSPDDWDADFSERVRNLNASAQALEDAIAVRDLLLTAFPDVRSAKLRVFRRTVDGAPDLIIAGTVSRDTEPDEEIPSLAMRAKLSGFQFWLEDGVLGPLQKKAVALSNS